MASQVYDFEDYRDFLNTRFLENKKAVKATSFQKFALASQRSRAYLKNVLSKKRHLSLDTIEDVAKFLRLSSIEKDYVLYSYLSSQASTTEVQKHFDKALLILREQIKDEAQAKRPPADAISAEAKSYLFAHLKDAIVASLALRPDFQMKADWVARQMVGTARVEVDEAESILRRLREAGILRKKESGGYELIEDQFHKIHPVEFNVFKSSLEMTLEALPQALEHRPCRFETGVWALTDEEYEKALVELKKLLARLARWSRSGGRKERRIYLSTISLLCAAAPRKSR